MRLSKINLAAVFAICIMALPAMGSAQETDYKPGLYEEKPYLTPEKAPDLRSVFENKNCKHIVGGQNYIGKVITEKCTSSKRVSGKRIKIQATRNLAFPHVRYPSFVLTILVKKEDLHTGKTIRTGCWVNKTLADLGKNPSTIKLLGALRRLSKQYIHTEGNKECEKVLNDLPF